MNQQNNTDRGSKMYTCKSLAEYISEHSIKPMSQRYLQQMCAKYTKTGKGLRCVKTGTNTSAYIIFESDAMAYYRQREAKLTNSKTSFD